MPAPSVGHTVGSAVFFRPTYWFQALLGLAFLGSGAWLIADFPVARPWLAALAVILFAAQWRYEHVWLIAFPALLPVLDLAPWSGRFLLDELDAMLALLAAAALLSGRYAASGRQLIRRTYLPVWPLLLSVLVSMFIGLTPFYALDANAWYGYLSGWNALRVGKGMLWAFVFLPLLLRQMSDDRESTERHLTLGVTVGLFLFGLAVLWEKRFFYDLWTASDVWGLFANWLHLSGHYRITGLFSQMHFGGEAVDGYLVLAWPFAFYLLLKSQSRGMFVFASVALTVAAYAVMVTFTRATYAATGLAFLIFVSASLSGRVPLQAKYLGLATVFLVFTFALFVLGFRFGGTYVIAGYLIVVLGSFLLGIYGRLVLRGVSIAPFAGLAGLAGFGIAIRGMVSSKWHETELLVAIAVALPSVLLMSAGAWYIGRQLANRLTPRVVFAALTAVSVLLSIGALALSGYRMNVRLETASEDFQGRWDHWSHGIGLMPGGAMPVIVGSGLGSFPIASLTEPERAGTVGSYHFLAPDPVLRLVGNGDLRFGQRLAGFQPGVYRLRVSARGVAGKPRLVVSVTDRHLLEQYRDQQGARARFDVSESKEGLTDFEQQLDLRKLGGRRWYVPTFAVLSFGNAGSDGSALDIAHVSLIDQTGKELVRNGAFRQGGDHWLPYNDYRHLLWHLKSFYVNVYFGLGLLGSAAFLILLVSAYSRSRRHARHGSLFSVALLAAMSGFLILGLVSTLLDVPRLMTFLLLLAFMALWRPRIGGSRRRSASASRRV